MEFNKNANLILNICLVQIRSVDATVNIPQLTTIYHTPSKINYSQSSKLTPSGVLIKKKLSLNYPGLSETDFDNFNDLVRGVYQVYVKTQTNDIWEIASDLFFMECDTSFNIKSGFKLNFKSATGIKNVFRGNQSAEGIDAGGFDYDFNFYVS